MVVERKKVTYKESVFYVEHFPGIFFTECGKINALINCPFYEVIFRDEKYTFCRSVKNKKVSTVKNLERHRCLLLDQVYGVQTGNELWELCPGEKVEERR